MDNLIELLNRKTNGWPCLLALSDDGLRNQKKGG